jgi:transposase-like protein
LESARVEVAVLLNDLAYLKYEASKDTSTTVETILLKQRNVAIAFSLVERVIKLTSTMDEVEGKQKLIC